jgi:hypothetical protein
MVLCSKVIGTPISETSRSPYQSYPAYGLLRLWLSQVSSRVFVIETWLPPCSGRDRHDRRSVAGKPFRLGKTRVCSRQSVHGDARGDCHGLLRDKLKGTDHFVVYREFAVYRG